MNNAQGCRLVVFSVCKNFHHLARYFDIVTLDTFTNERYNNKPLILI